MAYPSTIGTFVNPVPTDRLSTTPHSAIETAQNTDLTAIETFIGTLSSAQGTLMYDIRSPNSNGGGHVQSANVGGTGQTVFTKGDILIASSSSVLTKLASSGNDNDFLAVNSSVATGVNWIPGVTAGQIQSQAFSYAGKDSGTGSVYAIYPTPCVLSLAEGQIFSFRATNANTTTTPALSVSSIIARPLKNTNGNSLGLGQIPASTLTLVQYNGNQSYFGVITPTPATGMTLLGSAPTGSGATLRFINLGTYQEFVVALDTVTSGNNVVTLQMALSSSNGSVYGTPFNISPAVSPPAFISGTVRVDNVGQVGTNKLIGSVTSIATITTGFSLNSGTTGIINALQFQFSAGNFASGNVNIYGI